MLSKDIKSKVDTLFKSIKDNDEFEIMFNNYKESNKLSMINFMKILKYMKFRNVNDKLKLEEKFIFDIIYQDNNKNNFRISINGENNINDFLGFVHLRKNHKIISILSQQYSDKEDFTFIKKIKDKSRIIDVDDLDIRFRISSEKPLVKDEFEILKNVSFSESNNVFFRYKQRLSLFLSDDAVLDLTIVKSSNDINKINKENKTYELELEKITTKQSGLDFLLNEAEKIKKILSDSNIIVNKSDSNNVIEEYKKLMFGSNQNSFTNLYSMQPISAEVQHVIDNIPNSYSTTDKADGDKYQLFAHLGRLFLISNNLVVKEINTFNGVDEIDSTIFEGELIFIQNKKKYIFMIFDCLYYDGKDLRNEVSLEKRLSHLYKFCKDIVKVKTYEIKPYSGNFNMKTIEDHYQKEIENYFSNLNSNIDTLNENGYLFNPKLFLFPQGGNNSEIFLFSKLIWLNCTKNTKVNCPYILDGIIYTGINQKYSKDRKEHRYPIYKYKPPHTNSLDVYVTFEKNYDTGGYMNIFDNSLPDKLEYNEYRVTNFFVGEQIGGSEKPVPFMPESNNDRAYFPIINGEVRDIDGNIVQNNTVIEVIYSLDPKLPHEYRWSILRTRWDKTESVNNHKKRYGNYKDSAIKIWKSMTEAVTIEEINNLANPDNYGGQMKILSSRLNSSIITSQKSQDIYYQKITSLIKKMREFHNWIKSIIIYTYCSPTRREQGGKIVRQSILDVGCGRGGDILKIYHARVGEYVGFDVDFEGIYSSSDGAISRYNHLKSKFPDFGKVSYLQADGGVLLNSEEQSKSLSNISNENKKMLEKTFYKDRKFDIISSQFVIHYLFGSETSINNLIINIKNHLKKDGYVLLTLFDANLVNKLFEDQDKYTSYYTNEDGKREILYEIVKKYSKLDNKIGNPIDVHMGWINDTDKYIEEYLVPKELMISTMKKSGCRLVDTDLFSNIFNYNKSYFQEAIKFEENPKNKQFYEKVAQFYGDLKGADKESKNYSFLFRYYVFQKIE
jgi:SAM-dependent methyltransferase